MALPRANRLKQRRDFDVVYQKGIRRKTSHLTLRALRQQQILLASAEVRAPNSSQSLALKAAQRPTRIGITISQKVSKRAIVRNRIKRQLQSVFSQLLHRFPEGWDLVVVVHPGAIQCDYLQFLQELEQLLIDAEVLNGHS